MAFPAMWTMSQSKNSPSIAGGPLRGRKKEGERERKNPLDVYSVTLHLEESNKKFESIERGSEFRRKIAVKKYNPLSS